MLASKKVRRHDKLSILGWILYGVGAITWQRATPFDDRPWIRRLHPLSLIVLLIAFVLFIFIDGISGALEGVKDLWVDSVWWFAPPPKVDKFGNTL